MKQNLLFLLASTLLLITTSFNASAVTVVGSEIYYRCTSTPGIFVATLILYRNCDSEPLCTGACGSACSQTMTLEGADSAYSTIVYGTINLSLVSVRNVHINNDCPGVTNTCSNMGCITPGSYSPGIERYEFSGFVNIGSSAGIPPLCCNVRIAWSSCCRDSTIATGAANSNFYTDAIINRCLSISPCNSSPIFTNDPYSVICGGAPYMYNNGAVDPDLTDSLSYRFVSSLTGFGTPVTYTSPFSEDKPMPWIVSADGTFPSGISCNAINGDILFTPPNSGLVPFSGVMAIEVKQWKLIQNIPTVVGITRRDIQMIVKGDCPPDSNPHLITSPAGNPAQTTPKTTWEVRASEQLCFTVTAKDTDFNLPTVSDTTYLSWNNALSSFGATFLPDYDPAKRHLPDSLGGGPREDRYMFCWTPDSSLVSTKPYYFTLTAKDSRCPKPGLITRAFSITVLPKSINMGIQETANPLGIKIYPNPAQSVLNIKTDLTLPQTTIKLYTITGKLVFEKETKGTSEMQLDIEKLPSGLYFIQIGEWRRQIIKE